MFALSKCAYKIPHPGDLLQGQVLGPIGQVGRVRGGLSQVGLDLGVALLQLLELLFLQQFHSLWQGGIQYIKRSVTKKSHFLLISILLRFAQQSRFESFQRQCRNSAATALTVSWLRRPTLPALSKPLSFLLLALIDSKILWKLKQVDCAGTSQMQKNACHVMIWWSSFGVC